MPAENYPYKEVGGECQYDAEKGLIAASGFTLLDEGHPYLMQAALELGPLSVALDASSNVFRFYKEGVFDHGDMCGSDLNHAVAIVGY
mmetsp:Transcript_12349/g.15749  ORF Transcript_12349/g.15749 Transcript_12349/m.15749 type:complete len:88 (+) Transcript_12349:580-843(+)